MLMCGPTGVGKSTIGFELYLGSLRAGLMAGYVDLGQLAFIDPGASDDPGWHRLKAHNLAAIWQTYHAARRDHTLCRLHTGRAELTRRIMSRGAGGSWARPGDPLRGQPDAYLRNDRLAMLRVHGAHQPSGYFVLRGAVSLRPGWLSSGNATGKVAAAFFNRSPSAEVPSTAVSLLCACWACSWARDRPWLPNQ
jgi:hypothetical protein